MQRTPSHIPAQKSSMARPHRRWVTPELAVLEFKTLHHLGLTSQNFSLGIWCLRHCGECGPTTQLPTHLLLLISLPESPFTAIFVGQILHSIKGTAEILLDSPLFCQTTTSPKVGGISRIYGPFPLLLLLRYLLSVSAGCTWLVSALLACTCLGRGATLPHRVHCPEQVLSE